MRRFLFAAMLLAGLCLCLACTAARAQSKPVNPAIPPPPPPSNSASPNSSAPPSSSAPQPPVTKHDPTVPPPPPTEEDAAAEEPEKPDLPAYDPVAAERSIEVGQFYMKQGNYEAAIDRFNDAVKQHPGYGKPFELLGLAYEKKRDFANAIKSYQQCLRVYPHDPDRKKIEAHIADLQKKQQEEKAGK